MCNLMQNVGTKMKKLLLASKGETIIEVLIALSMLGLAVGIGYSSVNSSVRTAQDSKERAEAYQIAQGMIESVRFLNTRPDLDSSSSEYELLYPSTTTSASEFCIHPDPARYNDIEDTLFDLPDPIPQDNPSNETTQACLRGEYGGAEGIGRYSSWVQAERTQGSGDPAGAERSEFIYSANVSWESLDGREDNIVLKYKWTVLGGSDD